MVRVLEGEEEETLPSQEPLGETLDLTRETEVKQTRSVGCHCHLAAQQR